MANEIAAGESKNLHQIESSQRGRSEREILELSQTSSKQDRKTSGHTTYLPMTQAPKDEERIQPRRRLQLKKTGGGRHCGAIKPEGKAVGIADIKFRY